MENQLAEYRARKEKERKAQRSWTDSLLYLFFKSKTSEQTPQAKETTTNLKTNVSHIHNGEIIYNETEEDLVRNSKWKIFTLQNLLILILWIVLWKVFIELEFGAVYFLTTGFLFLYFNTRTGPRETRLSAYSVFNPNFERIGGTLTAEQFENELLRRPVKHDD